jgi:hypothetical protein
MIYYMDHNNESLNQQLKDLIGHKFVFVLISSGSASKTGAFDPENLRFIDVILLSAVQTSLLRRLCSQCDQQQPIFQERSLVSSTLTKYHLTDHSCKGGTALLLSELCREKKIALDMIPFFLKHKSQQDIITSTTAGYLPIPGRANILQVRGIFNTAVELRRVICQDI